MVCVWDDLVVLSSGDGRGCELGGADSARSGRVHVSPFLSTRPLDGQLPDDESIAALLIELRDLGAEERERLIDPMRTQAPYWRYAVDWPVLPDNPVRSVA